MSNKETYIANGVEKIFYFNFPFYQLGDIIVTVNDRRDMPGFAIQIGIPNKTATFPYSGGAVHFATAPKIGTKIEIYREFILTRPCDYQPTVQPRSDELNSDFNFNLENMRDFRRLLKEFDINYANISNLTNVSELTQRIDTLLVQMESFGELDEKSAALASEITKLGAKIEELMRDPSIETLPIIADIRGALTALGVRIDNVVKSPLPVGADYIVSSKSYTNYTDAYGNLCPLYNIDTWASGKTEICATGIVKGDSLNVFYRKDKSGFIEQGGSVNAIGTDGKTITLPIIMSNVYYNITMGVYNNAPASQIMYIRTPSTKTGFGLKAITATGETLTTGYWMVHGKCGV